MSKQTVELATQQIVAGTIRNTINQFLPDRKARPCSKRTIEFYSVELMYFTRFLTTCAVGLINMHEKTAGVLRKYLLPVAEYRNRL